MKISELVKELKQHKCYKKRCTYYERLRYPEDLNVIKKIDKKRPKELTFYKGALND